MFNTCRCCQCYQISNCFIMTEVNDPEHTAEWRKSNEIQFPDGVPDLESLDIYLFSNGQQYSPPRKYHLHGDELHWWDATLNFLARTHYGPMHPKIDLFSTNGQKVKTPLELADGVAYVAVEPHSAFIDSGYDKYLVKASRSLEKRQPKKSGDETAVAVDSKSNRRTSEKLIHSNIINTVFTSPSAAQLSDLKLNAQKQNGKVTKPSDKRRSLLLQRPTTPRKIYPIHPPLVTKKPKNKEKDEAWNNNKVFNRTNDKKPANLPSDNLPKLLKAKQNKTPHKSIESAPKLSVPKVDKIENNPKQSIQTDTDVNIPSVQTKINNINTPADKVQISDQFHTEKNVNHAQILPTPQDQENKEDEALTSGESATKPTAEKSDPPQEADDTIKSTDAQKDLNTIDMNESTPLQDIVPNDKHNETFMALINRGDIINFRLNIEIRNAEGAVTNRTMSRSYTNSAKSDKYSQVNNIEQDIYINNRSWLSTFPCVTIPEHDTKIVKCTCCEKFYTNNLNYVATEVVVKENQKCILLMPLSSNRPERCPCVDDGPSHIEQAKENLGSNSIYSVPNLPTRTVPFIFNEDANKKNNNDEDIPENLISSESKDIHKKSGDDQMLKGNGNESKVSFMQPYVQKATKADYSEALENASMEINPKPRDTNPQQPIPEIPKPQIIIPNIHSFHPTDNKEMKDIVVVRKNSEDPNSKCAIDDTTQTDWEDILLVARQHENGRYSFHLPPLSAVKNLKS